MKREILKKRTFLWFDLTPRWKMWKRIEELEIEVGKALAERETAYQDLASMNQKFLALTHDLDSMQNESLNWRANSRSSIGPAAKAANM